jgi:hypothetical protein
MSTDVAGTVRTGAVRIGSEVYPVSVEPGSGQAHRLTVGPPSTDPGAVGEQLVAAMATDVAAAVRRRLDLYRIDSSGLRVSAEYPDGASRVELRVTVPGLPAERTRDLLALARFCAGHCAAGRVPELGVSVAVA